MNVVLKCHDIESIQFHNTPEEIYTRLARTFPSYIDNGFEENSIAQPVLIDFVPGLALPVGAKYISSAAAFTDSSYYRLDKKGHAICLDQSKPNSAFHFKISPHINWNLLEGFIEIILHTLALNRQKAFFHSGAIGVDGQAIVLCGWANIGKTESIIEFLRRGYTYIGDDWTIIGENATVYSYDKTIAMYPHDIAVSTEVVKTYHGRVRGSILSRYCQLYQPGKVEHLSLSLKDRIDRRILRKLVRGLHLNMSIRVRADQITPNGTLCTAPLKVLYFMTRANIPEIVFTPLQADELIARMLPCYRYETRLFWDSELFEFAFPSKGFGPGLQISDVESIWSEAFSYPKVRLYTLQIPAATKPKKLVSRLETHIRQCCE